MTNSALQLGEDSPKRRKQLDYVDKKLNKQVSYRYHAEESARIEASNRKTDFESYTKTGFTDTEPRGKGKAQKLWKKAKKALDKYNETKSRFLRNEFCNPPMSDTICKKAFRNSFFKKEKLTYDKSKPVDGNGCRSIVFTKRDDHKKYQMEYKMCFAKKKIGKHTQPVDVVVFLQAAYKQPLLGRWRFFVIYIYSPDLVTQQWNMISHLSVESKGNRVRYEAYLHL